MNSGFTEIKFSNHNYQIADISTLANIKKIPYSYRILAENVLRQKYQGQNEFADQQMEYIVTDIFAVKHSRLKSYKNKEF